ncbi:hypothetical protein AB733_03430 [Photobacterium swingsii]|uniref:Uncharacterized protein n=1 Tax=Photobacterium swingsii TaxID=680026 RepID=A0A0J8VEX2_9GAMM|nr:hypothetical protein AB733_03430 [Photobacterium swingsii]PSW25458.1 hypothetical protein C9I94_07345 [Photobacterium swingsii]
MKRIKNARYPHFLRQNESLIARNIKCLFLNLWDVMTGNRGYIGVDYDDYRKNWLNKDMRINHRANLIQSLSPYLNHSAVKDAIDSLAQSEDLTLSSNEIYLVWQNVSETIDEVCRYDVKHPLVEVERDLARVYRSS